MKWSSVLSSTRTTSYILMRQGGMILSLLLILFNNIPIPLRKLFLIRSYDSTMKTLSQEVEQASHRNTLKVLSSQLHLTSKLWLLKRMPEWPRQNLLSSSQQIIRLNLRTRVTENDLMGVAMATNTAILGFLSSKLNSIE